MSSYLVRVKLCCLEKKTIRSNNCRWSHCQVCHSITKTGIIICNNDQSPFQINYRFDCNEKCFISLITWNHCQKQCKKVQAKEIKSIGWNNCKGNVRKFDRVKLSMQRYLYEHFVLPWHCGFPNDVCLTLINKTDPRCPNKKEDYYYIYPLETKKPVGLNLDFEDYII